MIKPRHNKFVWRQQQQQQAVLLTAFVFYAAFLLSFTHTSLLCTIFTFYSALSTFFLANLVARLAALRHKTTYSATTLAETSRIVAVSGISASAAAAAATKRAVAVHVLTLHSVVCTLNSVLA